MGLNDAGVPGRNLPASEDHIMRRLADLERAQRELGPSIARSFKPAMDSINANLTSINSLLTQVVKAQSIYVDTTNLAFDTTYAVKASTTITVPSGFTQAIVSLVGRVGCYNLHTTGGSNSAGGDYIFCKPAIGATLGDPFGAILLGTGGFNYDVTPLTALLPGLTGGSTFVVSVSGKVNFAAMAANALNEATLSGTILWLK